MQVQRSAGSYNGKPGESHQFTVHAAALGSLLQEVVEAFQSILELSASNVRVCVFLLHGAVHVFARIFVHLEWVPHLFSRSCDKLMLEVCRCSVELLVTSPLKTQRVLWKSEGWLQHSSSSRRDRRCPLSNGERCCTEQQKEIPRTRVLSPKHAMTQGKEDFDFASPPSTNGGLRKIDLSYDLVVSYTRKT
eukprot:552788-Rhodomonas_salina.2